jgi:hypothetical protein
MVKTNVPLAIPGIDCEFVDPFRDLTSIAKKLDTFATLYDKRPFDNTGGVLFDSAFAYYFFLQNLNPGVVIESGIWRGFSTWLIDSILPDSQLYCLDPVLMMPVAEPTYRPERAFLSTQDFSCFGFSEEVTTQACVVFDDHQNVFPRLEQALNYGISHVILDDNLYAETDHITLTHLLRVNHPTLSYIFDFVEEYFLFPPLIPPAPEGCPVKPLWDEIPSRISHLNTEQEFPYTWVTYLKLRPLFPTA